MSRRRGILRGILALVTQLALLLPLSLGFATNGERCLCGMKAGECSCALMMHAAAMKAAMKMAKGHCSGMGTGMAMGLSARCSLHVPRTPESDPPRLSLEVRNRLAVLATDGLVPGPALLADVAAPPDPLPARVDRTPEPRPPRPSLSAS